MVYTKQEWLDNDATKPLSAARLDYLETGIKSIHDTFDSAETGLGVRQDPNDPDLLILNPTGKLSDTEVATLIQSETSEVTAALKARIGTTSTAGPKVYVQTTEPTSWQENDIWVIPGGA